MVRLIGHIVKILQVRLDIRECIPVCLPLISGERVRRYFDMVNAHTHWSNLLIFCWDKMHTQVYQFMHYIVAWCSKWYVMVGNNLYLIYCLISDWLIKCIRWKANCSYVLIWFTFTHVELIQYESGNRDLAPFVTEGLIW